MEKPEFLKQSYPELADSEPVRRSVEKAARRNPEINPEEISDDDKLNLHLGRIEKILNHKNSEGNNNALDLLKRNIVDASTIKVYKPDGKENRKLLKEVSRNLFKAEKELARQEGRGAEVSQIDEQLERLSGQEKDDKLIEIYKSKITEARSVQEKTLEHWMDYLTSGDSNYPTWFKYLMIKAVSKLGQLDEENEEFKKRFPQTLAPFPDLNQEAVGLVFAHITEHPEEKNDFNKLYATYFLKVKHEKREIISDVGQWEIIPQGADPREAMARIQGFSTGWCIATNLADMERYLKGGELHIFFSEDEHGQDIIPRVCIYVENGNVKEVRGVAKDQNLEGRMTDITDQKKKELPGGNQYDKRSVDMKFLTAIESKIKLNEALDKDDLIFLYEINAPIEGFGYQRDPRIEEIRGARNVEVDMPIVFGCNKDQIAYDISEIKADTKAYVGKLVPGIFDLIQEQNIEHVYTSFPEGKIRMEHFEVGGKNAEALIREMREKNINISPEAEYMMKSKEFVTLEQSESGDFIRLKVGDLGFPEGKYPTTDEVYKRIEELGLELCPAETGPRYRLQNTNQPLGEWTYIGMKQIADSGRDSDVFSVEHDEDGLWLDYNWTRPADKWDPDDGFLFRLRKKNLKT